MREYTELESGFPLIKTVDEVQYIVRSESALDKNIVLTNIRSSTKGAFQLKEYQFFHELTLSVASYIKVQYILYLLSLTAHIVPTKTNS